MNYVLDAIEDGDGAVLSVWADDARPGETREDLVRRLCESGEIPHRKVQVGTLGDLLDVVDDVMQESSEGEPETHYHAIFGEPMALSQVEAFVNAMGEPEPNPTGGKP